VARRDRDQRSRSDPSRREKQKDVRQRGPVPSPQKERAADRGEDDVLAGLEGKGGIGIPGVERRVDPKRIAVGVIQQAERERREEHRRPDSRRGRLPSAEAAERLVQIRSTVGCTGAGQAVALGRRLHEI
jgi:hypothetical protein